MNTLHTLQEVAENWKVNPATVIRQVDRGLLKGFKIGTDWRFTAEQLNNYLEQREVDKSKRRLKKTA